MPSNFEVREATFHVLPAVLEAEESERRSSHKSSHRSDNRCATDSPSHSHRRKWIVSRKDKHYGTESSYRMNHESQINLAPLSSFDEIKDCASQRSKKSFDYSFALFFHSLTRKHVVTAVRHASECLRVWFTYVRTYFTVSSR